MLTRLRVKGFKNLVDVDVSFGPFTCVAGANGVGKSNLFDAILFLGALADRPFQDAALSVRNRGAGTEDIRDIFHRAGGSHAEELSFDAEILIPRAGLDELGRPVRPEATFVEYQAVLRYRSPSGTSLGNFELLSERLTAVPSSEAARRLPFAPRPWIKAVVKNPRRETEFIFTEGNGTDRVTGLRKRGKGSSKPRKVRTANLSRTMLSGVSSAESPVAALVRSEMQSWRMLRLDPAALREPDRLSAPSELTITGAHLPATLYRLALQPPPGLDAEAVYTEAANLLSRVTNGVRHIRVERDEQRQLLSLVATGRDGTTILARDLSDGTLRFLALAALALDPALRGLICIEEPENGIHPDRVSGVVDTLKSIATDTDDPAGTHLCQVMINTHSPVVVANVPDDSLVLAGLETRVSGGAAYEALRLHGLPATWRGETAGLGPVISKGTLLPYLLPAVHPLDTTWKRVMDRDDLAPIRAREF